MAKRAKSIVEAEKRFVRELEDYKYFIANLKALVKGRGGIKKPRKEDELKWKEWKTRLKEAVIILKLDRERVLQLCNEAGLEQRFREITWVDACMQEWKDEEAREERDADRQDKKDYRRATRR